MIGSWIAGIGRCSPKGTAGAGLRVVAITLLGLAQAGCLPATAPAVRSAAGPPPTALSGPRAALGQLPLYFIANRGQMDSQVAYYLQGHQTGLYFTAEGVTFALRSPAGPSATSDRVQPADAPPGWTVKLDFVDPRPGVEPVGRAQTETVVSYFTGPSDQWQTGLPTYGQVVYEDLWPGIDLVYSGTVNRLKYDFVVKPGADPGQIRLAYRGTTEVRFAAGGQLEVATPIGGFTDEAPYAYQEATGGRVEVAAAYDLQAIDGAYTYGFRVGAYDRSLPLVLDPAVIVYAGYIGGADFDRGFAIAVDGAGSAYVTGVTFSSQGSRFRRQGFPTEAGPDLTYNGMEDAFVAKVKADGTGLVYAGYLGGSGRDEGFGIAVDGAGHAYVTGRTNSDQATFPVTVGPDLTFNGDFDAFVAKVKADGTGLVYAGYIGGRGEDSASAVAVDKAGNAYVTGRTASGEGGRFGDRGFPVKVGPDLTFNGAQDAFVAKVQPDGSGLVYAGYIGGSEGEGGSGIAVDGAGNAYVTGTTISDETTFPVAVGPSLSLSGRSSDAFVTKVKADGSGLVYAGYIGGDLGETGSGIGVDSAGSAYVTGDTGSDETTFPVTNGPDSTFNGGATDAYVAKVKADGSGLVYAGYIGGNENDRGFGLAVDAAGQAYVTGTTESGQGSFPVKTGPDLTLNGGRVRRPGDRTSVDAFVAKVGVAP